MKTYLVIKIPVQLPTDIINVTSEHLANGVVDYIRSFIIGEPEINFETAPENQRDIIPHSTSSSPTNMITNPVSHAQGPRTIF
jgi:hypothetical protein